MEAYKTLRAYIKKEGIATQRKVLNREEFLKRAHSIDTNIYFIEKGSVRVFFVEDFEEHTFYFGYKESIITALDSFFSGKNSQLEIEALKKTEVSYLSKEEFLKFIFSRQEYQELWYRVLEEIIVHQAEREKDLLISSPVKRYQRVLKRRPELFQEIPNKYIASYLRMSPETLSRVKKTLI
ncbi:cyclic nucleotide-binding domain-containing protein [uncultured Tenacibaculum sp.]|uniref:Crp/Fnr family transcriptional regulator n=1 Tax=uncultured Tenacibaculum sp. TaxID=174713 RepID=UPI00262629B3|nr:cyclic nucleotide-binding domain-containing protein [uncultured Tenacibaculum sp.]